MVANFGISLSRGLFIFRGYVSFKEGTSEKKKKKNNPSKVEYYQIIIPTKIIPKNFLKTNGPNGIEKLPNFISIHIFGWVKRAAFGCSCFPKTQQG